MIKEILKRLIRNALQVFPNVLFARILGFKNIYELFQASEGKREAPRFRGQRN